MWDHPRSWPIVISKMAMDVIRSRGHDKIIGRRNSIRRLDRLLLATCHQCLQGPLPSDALTAMKLDTCVVIALNWVK